MNTRRKAHNALFALTVLLALLLTVLFNGVMLLLANRHNLAFDLTRAAAYRLDAETLRLLDGLEGRVDIHVLSPREGFDGNPYLVQARSILDLYPRHSGQINLAYIDVASDPAFAANYPDLSLKPGNILVSSGGNVRQLALNDLFNYSYSAASASGTAVSSSRAQEAVSSAILQVVSGQPLRAALLVGADTAQAPALLSLLRDNNIQPSQVNLAGANLSGFDLVMLLAPMVDLSPDSLGLLDDFLYNEGEYGKTLLYTMDAAQPRLPNLAAYLSEWGAAVLEGAVFETNANMTYRMQPYYPLAEYTDESLAGALRDNSIKTLMPRAKPFSLLFSSRDFQHTSVLTSFSPTSAVRPAQAGSDFDPASAEVRGPLPALALLTRRDRSQPPKESALILSASTAMLEEAALGSAQLANSEYLLKLLESRAGRGQGVQLRPVSLAGANLGVSSGTAQWLAILLTAVLPGLLLLAGLFVFLYRRHQ